MAAPDRAQETQPERLDSDQIAAASQPSVALVATVRHRTSPSLYVCTQACLTGGPREPCRNDHSGQALHCIKVLGRGAQHDMRCRRSGSRTDVCSLSCSCFAYLRNGLVLSVPFQHRVIDRVTMAL